MSRNLKSVAQFAQFAQAGPFTQNQLRWWIFNSGANGLAESGAIVRVQRRIYLDVDKFERWIDAQQPAPVAAA